MRRKHPGPCAALQTLLRQTGSPSGNAVTGSPSFWCFLSSFYLDETVCAIELAPKNFRFFAALFPPSDPSFFALRRASAPPPQGPRLPAAGTSWNN